MLTVARRIKYDFKLTHPAVSSLLAPDARRCYFCTTIEPSLPTPRPILDGREHAKRSVAFGCQLMNTMSDTDELAQLLLQIGGGDEQALARLYQKLSRRIYAFSLRRINNTDLAEEVVVETMYEVWRNAKKFDGRSQVSTWVLGIARYKTLDKLRQINRHETTSDEEVLESITDESASTYDTLLQKQQSEQIARCLGTLPDDQRECLHCAFYEEMSIHEIAQLQDIPSNTVKTRLFHARRKLKECLERQSRWLGES